MRSWWRDYYAEKEGYSGQLGLFAANVLELVLLTLIRLMYLLTIRSAPAALSLQGPSRHSSLRTVFRCTGLGLNVQVRPTQGGGGGGGDVKKQAGHSGCTAGQQMFEAR